MLTSQLFWRIFAIYAGLTLCTAFAFALTLTAGYRDLAYPQVEARQIDNAQILLPQLRKIPADDRWDFLRTINSTSETRFEVLTLDQARQKANAEPELADALAHRIGTSRRPNANALFQFYAIEFEAHGETLILRMTTPLDSVTENLSWISARLWATAFTLVLIGLIVTYVMVARIIQPLDRLTHAAEQMALGESPKGLNFDSQNEIGTLARTLRNMDRQLAQRFSELEKQSQELEEKHEQLATVLRSMIEGVIAVDRSEQILFANDTVFQLLDVQPQSFMRRPIWEAVRHPQVQKIVQAALSGQPSEKVEFDVARTQRTLAMVASPLPGEPATGAVLVLHDVTDLRRLENLRREFVSNVSHELKTPLTSISAYAETLLNGAMEDEETCRTFLQRIEEQAERLNKLIADLIALARLDSIEQAFELEPVNATYILQKSIDEHQGVAKSKQIELISVAPNEEMEVIADSDGFQTIIDNLLDNALNYTPSGGRVTVRWRLEGEWSRIDVEDTGVGIPREHQARIFERFYRVDKARSREVGGTGLGLSIVKHLCQVFGGSIRVTSQVGSGSQFTVLLKNGQNSNGQTWM